jgi:hypothetical protein
MSKQKWSGMTIVDVPLPMTGDERIWWVYSLCLEINRHVADCIDDDDVSSALNKMVARHHPLPYGFEL